MIHIKSKDYIPEKNTAIMLGNFDGLHIGHQSLIAALKEKSVVQGLLACAFSFYPHPASFFTRKPFTTILTSEEKAYLLGHLGVDVFMEYPFDESFVNLEPEEFVKEILVKRLKCKVVVVGCGYRFGKDQRGDEVLLNNLGQKYGFETLIIEHMKMDNVKVSSTEIRCLILQRDFDKATALMSRPYFILGKVAHGRKIGRSIGFPTVNLELDKAKLLPQSGIYFTKTLVKSKLYNSITNIGVNPTIGETTKRAETYIYDFSEDIYGETIVVSFHKWLRNEEKFDGIEELRAKIDEDVQMGRLYFKEG